MINLFEFRIQADRYDNYIRGSGTLKSTSAELIIEKYVLKMQTSSS